MGDVPDLEGLWGHPALLVVCFARIFLLVP